jgi:large-conductance mechanosensitive channel
MEKPMPLAADFRHFIDEAGNVLELTDQAKVVFVFLSKIVLALSENIEQPLVHVNLKCNTRAKQLSCTGQIQAKSITLGLIEWHCDTCQACGTITHWQGSRWDKQQRVIH